MIYIVTEWAENGTLTSYLAKSPAADRLELLHGVASALDYLHTRPNPIVHGDISAYNVLVDGKGTALLSDFGLSTTVSANDGTSTDPGDSMMNYFMGRPAYEAPELHDPHPRRTPATDVFAFGMLVFHTYANKVPFAGLKENAIIVAIYSGKRPARSDIMREDFPDALWELVQACWSHDPTGRPSMSVVEGRLEELRRSRRAVRQK